MEHLRNEKNWYTVKETALLLGVTKETVRKYIRQGYIKADKLFGSNLYRINAENLFNNMQGGENKL